MTGLWKILHLQKLCEIAGLSESGRRHLPIFLNGQCRVSRVNRTVVRVRLRCRHATPSLRRSNLPKHGIVALRNVRSRRHMAEPGDVGRRQADCIPRNARRNGNSRYDSSLQGGRLTGIGGRVITLGNGQIALGDCLDVMRSVPSASVDMILCDLPYGTTQNKWDSVIPFAPLWSEYWRICRGPVVLTAAQPFTTMLINSQFDFFKYALVWDKVGTVGFQLANIRPLSRHEDVLLFYRKQPTYNPQKEVRGKPRKKGGSQVDNGNYGALRSSESFNNEYHPTSILEFSNAGKSGRIHPTQKPVALFEYLIRTYTNEGNTVMDNCLGSGTTAIAAENTGRRWIGIERDPTYFGAACERIARAVGRFGT